ncbi:MAG: hypothetical protein D6714_11875, partial [Bacteroidetes bacterium]
MILSVMLIAGIAAWYFVGKLPPTYKSSAMISAGIFEFKGLTLPKENVFIQQYEIDARFNQLIKDMTSRKSIRRVTNRLLEHDLRDTNPFRQPNEELLAKAGISLDDFGLALQTNFGDTTETPDFENYNRVIAEAFGYDYETLMKHLTVRREGDTDYVTVAFESESPELSHFVVQTYCREFLDFFQDVVTREENEKVMFYTRLVGQKKQTLDSIVNEINQYKAANGLIDVGTQSESVIGAIQNYEDKREKEYQKIPALRAAISILEDRILRYNRSFSAAYAEDLYGREDFYEIDQEIKKLREQLQRGVGNTTSIQEKIKKLESQKAELIAQYAKANIHNDHPIHDQVKQWIREKTEKEIELEFALKSVASYDRELGGLNARVGKLQRDDAKLANMEKFRETIEKQYRENLSELEKAKLIAESVENPLSVIEEAEMPEKPESNHRAIITAFSGVAGGTLASIFIFILALMDTTIQSPSRFYQKTRLPLTGYVNKIKSGQVPDLHYLFHSENPKKELVHFREAIRKLRSMVESSGKRSFLFVSPKDGEGKSFLIVLLAYAMSLNNRRILIIDTNFRNNTLSEYKNTPFWTQTGDGRGGLIKNWIGGKKQANMPPPERDPDTGWSLRNVDIIGNKNGNQSPSEVLAGKDFDRVMRNYSTRYDYIFLEAASMNQYSDAMELLPFVDKLIGVFSAERPLGEADKETLEYL